MDATQKGKAIVTKKNIETLTAFLDIMQGDPVYAKASRALGIHETTPFRWIKESRRASEHPEQPSLYFLDYAGEKKWFWQHLRDCISASVERIEQAARSRAEHGHSTQSFFQGHAQYKLDPDWEDEELRTLLGLRDQWLRDSNGDRIPEMVHHPAPVDLIAMVLTAHSKKYRRQSQVDVNVRGQIGGVLHLGNQPPAKSVTHQATLPMLEILSAAAEPQPVAPVSEPEADADDVDEIAEQADADDVDEVSEPAAVASPPPPSEPVRRELTPLQRDLISRARMRLDDPARSAPVGANSNK
jgi:hypothetical protein